MDRPVISLVDLRLRDAGLAMPAPAGATLSHNGAVHDQRQRPLRDLRISVTDRCNFRCSYCMPKDVFDKDHQYLPHRDLLSFEEISRSARLFAQLGVGKLRITGGEPLLRKNLEALIAQLAQIETLNGSPMDLTLTTNGSILARKARALKDAGLKRLTVSLDSLSDPLFPPDERHGFPGRHRAAGHRNRAGGRLCQYQGEHGRQARRQ